MGVQIVMKEGLGSRQTIPDKHLLIALETKEEVLNGANSSLPSQTLARPSLPASQSLATCALRPPTHVQTALDPWLAQLDRALSPTPQAELCFASREQAGLEEDHTLREKMTGPSQWRAPPYPIVNFRWPIQ